MQHLRLLLFCLVLSGPRVGAQESGELALVVCAGEKIAVFEGTRSGDGRYALGWTFRPATPAAEPVDWTTYAVDNYDWFQRYEEPVGADGRDVYELFNGLLDLREHTFTVLDADGPYRPHSHHHGLNIAWSGERAGKRYAIVCNDLRFNTQNLWLVRIDSAGIHVKDLAEAADVTVVNTLHKKVPATYGDYTVTYAAGADTSGKDSAIRPAKDGTLGIPFSAGVPKKADVPFFEGRVFVRLSTGTVVGIRDLKTE